MSTISVEQFEGKVDSLYRLVILAAKRATQISKPDARPLVPVRSRKPTLVALEEVLSGKVKARLGTGDEEDFLE
ncbi:MAG TPA: DNA-directed RNA polymerase subunit omega [Candidatus Hydrogenedentes bacterium]|nr:DNA-directed RNA polymerase subunit omega [Candidatus Hydrogenedentota bacterium]HRK34924.1 DNA-directed RNA polymerase subunit omega [Candidatus Hydrogenedentota bacterium]